jgi:hypothetical protein
MVMARQRTLGADFQASGTLNDALRRAWELGLCPRRVGTFRALSRRVDGEPATSPRDFPVNRKGVSRWTS